MTNKATVGNRNGNKTLLLFTVSYPYLKAAESSFIKNELPHLLGQFQRIILIPYSIGGDKDTGIDSRIEVDESFAEHHANKVGFLTQIVQSLTTARFYKELMLNPRVLVKPSQLLRLNQSIARQRVTKRWYQLWSNQSDKSDLVVYTYWFTHVTDFFCSLKKAVPVLSRVHGSDMYLERNEGYIPFRKTSLNAISNVYCVSKAGLDYMQNTYPYIKNKFKLYRLGVLGNQSGMSFNTMKDSEFLSVSCSAIIPLKQVDLILKSVIGLAEENPQEKFVHTHFGDGPLLEDLKAMVTNLKLQNLTVNLLGSRKNEEVLQYLSSNPVNVFVNASTTEGGCPVAIQEAQSFGIPFIGTAVGGIPEMHTGENGILLSQNVTYNDLKTAINTILQLSDLEQQAMRRNSYENWQNHFNSETNFRRFALEISKL